MQQAADLVAGQLGIADEPQMCLEAERGQRLGQPFDACGKTTRTRVRVRPLE
ncbi:MAG: hypothetical protein JRS35_28950 [Deltaproteobacteria bacterium]|nr:hypothetical protein [Deltaproteobacteria bacterium]